MRVNGADGRPWEFHAPGAAMPQRQSQAGRDASFRVYPVVTAFRRGGIKRLTSAWARASVTSRKSVPSAHIGSVAR